MMWNESWKTRLNKLSNIFTTIIGIQTDSDEEEVQKIIAETQKKKRELKDHLKKDYKGTLGRIEKEVEKILKKENIIQDKKNVDY